MVNIRGLWTQTGVQTYEPTKFTIEPSYLRQFTTKEFDDANIAELFHENTKYKHDDYSLELGRAQVRFSADPDFKYLQGALRTDYPKKELVELPEPEEIDEGLGSVLARRRSRRVMSGESLSLQELSTLLQHSCGVTATGEAEISYGDETETIEQKLRAYPSGGALYPVEIYLLVMQETGDLTPGVYYYTPDKHALRVLKEDPELPEKTDDLFVEQGTELAAADSGVTFVLTGQFWRAMAKYGPRGYRNILQESGHLGQNITLVSQAMDLAHVPVAAYRDDELNDYLEIDGVDEAVVYSIYVGKQTGDSNE